MLIRKLEKKDETRWRELWDGYCDFYKKELSSARTEYLWQRLMDANSTVHAIVAVNNDDFVVGIANYIIHENTSMPTPVCYLQDLFVDSDVRGAGIGRALIDFLVLEMKSNKWSRLYWHTKENNYQARQLYDRYTSQSGFLLYGISNEEI